MILIKKYIEMNQFFRKLVFTIIIFLFLEMNYELVIQMTYTLTNNEKKKLLNAVQLSN